MGKFEEAFEHIKKALEFEPTFHKAWTNLGDHYLHKKDYKKAIEHYEKALSLDPTYGNAWNNMGNVYFNNLDNKEKAHECFKEAVKFSPDDIAYANLAITYEEFGNIEKAIEYYNKALEYNPRFVSALNNLAYIHRQLNEARKSIEYAEKAIEIDSECWGAWYHMGFGYFELEDYKRALECFEKANKINPDDEHTRCMLIMARGEIESQDRRKKLFGFRQQDRIEEKNPSKPKKDLEIISPKIKKK